MRKRGKDFYVTMERDHAALFAARAERKVREKGVPEPIVDGIFSSLGIALERRELHGFTTDYRDPTEVNGLVNAAMGGNVHVHELHAPLRKYVVGILQTDEVTFVQAQQLIATQVD